MKTKADGYPHAGDPYRQEEINLILSLIPTHTNIKYLAKSLGRSEEAIETIYLKAYRDIWLRESILDARSMEAAVILIANAKKELGLVVGYNVKD